MAKKALRYHERAQYSLSSVAQRLFNLLDEKKTNLAFSADVTNAAQLLTLADQLGPEICVLKIHIDIIKDFSADLIKKLQKLAQKHHFLLFEDRKFADIGHTVKLQYEGGIYHIVDWADIVNAHSLPGPGIIQGLADVGRKKNRSLLLIAELSSAGNLTNESYKKHTLALAEKFPDFVIGFITQHALTKDPQWVNFTPGVKLNTGQDQLGQRYVTPEEAIGTNGTDIIIVGRGIIKAEDPIAEAQKYRVRAWKSYLQRLQ